MGADPVSTLVIPHRFCGPPASGNGGWTAGALAALLGHPREDPDLPDDRCRSWPPIEVSLTAPPPLDTLLEVTREDGVLVAREGTTVIARARVAEQPPVTVSEVPAATARAASAGYPGLRAHPFPTCFSCGPRRAEGDGLRIFPGPLPDDPADSAEGPGDSPRDPSTPTVAATWVPHPSVREDYHTYVDDHPQGRAALAVTWAALDCVGGWAGDLADRPMVLGRMTAQIETLPLIGAEHVVVGSRLGAQGRRTFTASALYGPDGGLLGRAEHVWVSVDPVAFARLR